MSHVCFRRLAAACIGMTLLLASGITGLTAKSTASQDAGVPQTWECFVEPVGLVSLLEIMNQLDEVEGSGIQEPVNAAFITPGEALRSVDQDGITQATWELAACINARDPFRLAALLTPELQARLVVDLLEGTGVEALGDQLPILDQIDPDQDLAEIPITAAWYSPFSPHEIEAVLSPQIEGLEEQRQFLVRFVYSDGTWLIDDMRVISGSVPGTEEGAHGIEGDAEATPSDETVVPQTTAEASPVGSPAADTVTVTSVDIAFEPTEVTIAADTDVTFMLPNEGAAPHNFSIDELSIDVDIEPGAEEEVVINAPAGEYEFYCNVPGHREVGMVGTLTVE